MRKPEQFSHVCSAQVSSGTDEPIPCEGEVILEYEANGPDDFILIQDGPVVCEHGHVQTQEWIDARYDHDWREMGERVAERHEAAYWDHINALIDKRRGK